MGTPDTIGVSEKKLQCPTTPAFVCCVGNRTLALAHVTCHMSRVRQVLCCGASVPGLGFFILLCLLSDSRITGRLAYPQGCFLSGSSL